MNSCGLSFGILVGGKILLYFHKGRAVQDCEEYDAQGTE